MDQMAKEEREQLEKERREELAALQEEELYSTTQVQFPNIDEKARNGVDKHRKTHQKDVMQKIVIPKRKFKIPNYMKPKETIVKNVTPSKSIVDKKGSIFEMTEKRRITISSKTNGAVDLSRFASMLKPGF